MHYRRFGKTNLLLSAFSLGTMRHLSSSENAVATVHRAIALGINHVETARSYGKSELYLAEALKSLPRDRIHITTKIVPTPDADSAEQSIDECLNRLGLEHLDCLAIHGLNTWEHLEWIKAPQGCMQAVQQAKEAGKVRHIGFSTHGSSELILAAIATDLFEFVNLHYYLFFQRHALVLAAAQAQDLGVLIISPADKGGMLYTPPALLEELCQPFAPLELNYRFLLSDRRLTTLSVGAANPSELNWPLAFADRHEPLSAVELEVLAKLCSHQATVLAADGCSQCYACLPCPEVIHIPEVLRLRNLAVAYEMLNFSQYRYRMFEHAGHWFPGRKANRCTACGDCLPRCPEQLNIPALLQDAHERLQGKAERRLWN